MLGSEKLRATRKKGQLERIKVKKKAKGNEYADYFAKLPKQILKAKVVEQITTYRNALAEALDDIQIAEETGKGLLAAQETAQVAALTIEKLKESLRPQGSVSLTGGGAK